MHLARTRTTSDRIMMLALSGCTALTTGCGAGWRQTPIDSPGSLSPRQQAQVWVHGGAPLRLKEVRWTADSVFGRPYLAELDGDTAKVIAIPRSRVDSVRTGNPSAGLWKTTGLVLVGLFVVGIAACALGQSCQLGD
jgi:hypothetical protein